MYLFIALIVFVAFLYLLSRPRMNEIEQQRHEANNDDATSKTNQSK